MNDLLRARLSRRRTIWVLARPPPPPPISRQQAVSLSQSSCASPFKFTDRRGGRGGAKSYDGGEKALSSINQSMLSDGSVMEQGRQLFFTTLYTVSAIGTTFDRNSKVFFFFPL